MTDELKPCPFCGGKAEFYEDEFGMNVRCKVCDAVLSTGVYGEEGRELAYDEWNSRTIENELHKKIRKLKAENKRLRESLAFYAHGKHLWDADERDPACDAYDLVSGQVENGKYAREVLEGGEE